MQQFGTTFRCSRNLTLRWQRAFNSHALHFFYLLIKTFVKLIVVRFRLHEPGWPG